MQINYDNIIFSLQRAGGISIYWAELVRRIKSNKNVEFYESENNNIFRKTFQLVTRKEIDINLKILRYLPFMQKLPQKSIFHGSYYRVSIQKNIVNITTVHDFTYEYFRSGLAKHIHVWQKGFAIKNSDGIICVSENTKKDLMKFYPRIDSSKLKVIYNGVGNEFKKLNNAHVLLNDELNVLKDKKYILYIGDRSSYKNFDLAVAVMKKLCDYSLVIVGGKDFNDVEKDMLNDIKNRTFRFKGINGDRLNVLYNNAFCLLYPSSYEGFGIPISEAMSAGCPVISTNISSIPEVAGNAALLVNEVTVESFLEKINILEDKQKRLKLILKGFLQAEKFSWDGCFNETYKFYEETYKRKFF